MPSLLEHHAKLSSPLLEIVMSFVRCARVGKAINRLDGIDIFLSSIKNHNIVLRLFKVALEILRCSARITPHQLSIQKLILSLLPMSQQQFTLRSLTLLFKPLQIN